MPTEPAGTSSRGAARRGVQRRVEAAEIREPRLESYEEHDVFAARVARDHFVGRQPGVRGDGRQIGAGGAAVLDRDLDVAARHGRDVSAVPRVAQRRRERLGG
jgi:hypothetical protein